MLQFYLLSVVTTVLTGFVLSGDFLGTRVPALATFRAWLESRGAAMTLGLATAVVGLVILFVPATSYGGRTVIFAGDLLPAIAGLVVGVALFFEALLRKPAAPERTVDRYAKAVLSYRVPLGIAGVAVALVHFLFPRAVIL
jgi:LytS/YehU family sensor histidine kinase